MRDTSDNEAFPQRLQETLSSLFAADPARREDALAALIEQNPSHGAELRRRFAELERQEARTKLVSTVPADAAESAPSRIGPFKILSVLGEGGMGKVYLAEQKSPVRRRVALKVIKLGMDSKLVLRRFEAERQALAMMEHDAIARVFEAGTTERGQPYFAMEHVRGVPLTQYCDENRLPLEARLRLFRDLCAGVQHAHQKGVIHRDLKPSNILVTAQDGTPRVKIIDFGLARATDHRLVEGTIFTEHGVLVGTPEYMSPEQAGLGGLDVDTRTDIYSLGVILYELLVGEPPFRAFELRKAGLHEIQRMIREDDPPRPSTRWSSLGDDRTQYAIRRSIQPGDLGRRLSRDLDWVTMRSLAKDRTMRYQTASGLAEDIERYLRGETVLASPPSWSYQLAKFVRRNRARVVAASLVLAAIVAGLIGTSIGLLDARESARKASEALAKFDRLSIGVRLTKALELERALYPAWPEHVGAMRRWIDRYGDPLVAALPELTQQRDELRAMAIPWSEEERQRDRRTHPDRGDAERTRAQIAAIEKQIDGALNATEQTRLERSLDALRQRGAMLQKRLRTRRTYRFPSESQEFLHVALTQLVTRLTDFVPVAEAVGERLRWASRIEDRSIKRYERAWNRAAKAVAADDRFGGWTLRPQIGLAPIGADPKSGLQEFAHLRSSDRGASVPERKPDGTLDFSASSGLVFVLLPGGRFAMGSQGRAGRPNFDPWRETNEGKAHFVTLAPLLISKYEMTQAQWLRLSRDGNPSSFSPETPATFGETITLTHPVETISWRRARAVLTPEGLDLPTEAQWEYAARAGTTDAFWTGPTVASLAGAANIADAHAVERRLDEPSASPDVDDGFLLHCAVDRLRPNPFGLHHVLGNVDEWCLDRLASYRQPPALRTGLRDNILASEYVYRGGSWRFGARHARCADRKTGKIDYGNRNLGVRPVRALRE